MSRADDLLATLEARFAAHPHRHPGISWDAVRGALDGAPEALATLAELEATGGEPDVVGRDRATNTITFFDCAAQSPTGRRSVCYDPEALAARKKHPPRDSAVGMARAMGAELLTEAEYQVLQALGEFDTTTSSWLHTPPEVRELGGAIFGDRRFGRVFTYHNGADSYYAARGFRCAVRIPAAP